MQGLSLRMGGSAIHGLFSLCPSSTIIKRLNSGVIMRLRFLDDYDLESTCLASEASDSEVLNLWSTS